VLLQENNAVAVVDVKTATIRAIYPLGFKNHSNTRNPLDPTDVPLKVTIGTWPVFGMYMPDEMKSFRCGRYNLKHNSKLQDLLRGLIVWYIGSSAA
jgi:hypothetical protein